MAQGRSRHIPIEIHKHKQCRPECITNQQKWYSLAQGVADCGYAFWIILHKVTAALARNWAEDLNNYQKLNDTVIGRRPDPGIR